MDKSNRPTKKEANHLHFHTSDSDVMIEDLSHNSSESKKEHLIAIRSFQIDKPNSNFQSHSKDEILMNVTLATPRIVQILNDLTDVESQVNQGVELLCAESRVDSWKKELMTLISGIDDTNHANTETQKVITYLLYRVSHIANDIKRKLNNQADAGFDANSPDRDDTKEKSQTKMAVTLHSSQILDNGYTGSLYFISLAIQCFGVATFGCLLMSTAMFIITLYYKQ